VLILVWDNARWHISQAVRAWIQEHNRQVQETGQGTRILVSPLPTKSPWLNPIEPKWVHGKRRIPEPDRSLCAPETDQRICAPLDCSLEVHFSVSEIVS
jgi:transposase